MTAPGAALPCDNAVCGACDEIDTSQILGASGTLGGGHSFGLSPSVIRDWPVTSDLAISFPGGGGTAFRLVHFPGQPSWPSVTGADGVSYSEAAVIVACFDKVGLGLYCQSGEHWTMDYMNGVRGMAWPEGRPVAWLLISSGAQKRTAIKYFDTWPFALDPSHALNTSTVGPNLVRRPCR